MTFEERHLRVTKNRLLVTLFSVYFRRGRKPVSVFKSAIYLRNLPPGIGRAALDCQYIWSCRLQGRTHMLSPTHAVSSCLTFSPLHALGMRLFSVTFTIRLPLSALSAVKCPFLSGLSSQQCCAADRPALIFRSAAFSRLYSICSPVCARCGHYT